MTRRIILFLDLFVVCIFLVFFLIWDLLFPDREHNLELQLEEEERKAGIR